MSNTVETIDAFRLSRANSTTCALAVAPLGGAHESLLSTLTRRVLVRPRRVVVVVLPLMGRTALLSHVNGTVTAIDDTAVGTSTVSSDGGRHRRVVVVVWGEQDSGAVESREVELFDASSMMRALFVFFGRLTHAINSSSSSKTNIDG